MAPSDLVKALASGFGKIENFGAKLFVYDGRMGHCVGVRGHNPVAGKFEYHDPWPGRSLLCREFNQAGVDAQQTNDRWQITEKELERVIFAAFVWPTHWADLTGRQYRIAYDALSKSDFFEFFHISEVRRTEKKDGQVVVFLEPGAFIKNIRLEILLDSLGVVQEGTLALRRSWVGGEQFALARDIAKSFVAALLPDPDRPHAEKVPAAIHELGNEGAIETLLARQREADLSSTEELQLAYLGLTDISCHNFTFCQIEAWNELRRKQAWLVLKVSLFVRAPPVPSRVDLLPIVGS